MVVATSVSSVCRTGNWVGPTRTALAWNRSRIPRSPKKPTIFRTISSNPGTDRRDWSAARSAGCSQATGAIWERITRGRAVGTDVIGCLREDAYRYPYDPPQVQFQELRTCAPSCLLRLAERLVEIRHQIVGILDSH